MEFCGLEVKLGAFCTPVKDGWAVPCQASAGHDCFQAGLSQTPWLRFCSPASYVHLGRDSITAIYSLTLQILML